MNPLLNMKVKRKLLVTSTILAIIFLIAIGVYHFVVTMTSSSYEHLINHDFVISEKANVIQKHINATRIAELEFLQTGDEKAQLMVYSHLEKIKELTNLIIQSASTEIWFTKTVLNAELIQNRSDEYYNAFKHIVKNYHGTGSDENSLLYSRLSSIAHVLHDFCTANITQVPEGLNLLFELRENEKKYQLNGRLEDHKTNHAINTRLITAFESSNLPRDVVGNIKEQIIFYQQVLNQVVAKDQILAIRSYALIEAAEDIEKSAEAIIVSIKKTTEDVRIATKNKSERYILMSQLFCFTAILLGIALMYYLNNLITKPIENIVKKTEDISAGNYNVVVPVSSSDEIGQLAVAFNNMVKDLNKNQNDIEQQNRELTRLRNYLSNIINSMPSMLIGVDVDGIITQWNLETEQAIGLSADDVVGQPLDKTIPRLSDIDKLIQAAFKTRHDQVDFKRKIIENDEINYEDITVYPLIANGVEGAVIRIDNVTDKVRMEEMMIQSEKMLSVGGLAAGMAHEINNPLAGMMQTANVMSDRLTRIEMDANLEAAKEAGLTMESLKAFMEKRGIVRMIKAINESGERVADIVDNMLSFARKSDSSVSSCNLTDLMDRILELAATDYDLKKKYDFKTIKIVKEYEENLPLVPCEGAKIQQVILNILRNGAQAMQENIDSPSFTLRLCCAHESGMIKIEIQDNGPGMDENTCKRIFEPFFTTKPVGTGTGLGLSVSYFIITENHDGTMDVISKPGQGACFIIKLPIERGKA